MSNISVEKNILEKAKKWLSGNYDQETKEEIQNIINNNPTELIDSFYKDLEFGTGGMRGIMGPGTNRMNKYTIGAAAQGLANYIKIAFPNKDNYSVAIAHDCRNNSHFFAETTANVLSANNIHVYLFSALRPTPELSFAIRELKCNSGVVITASHNPKEYNGFKAYWEDGGQLVNPHDVNVVKEVQKIQSVDEIHFHGNNELITIIDKEIDDKYLNKVCSLSLHPEIIEKNSDISIVYTALHGTGGTMVPKALKKLGFKNIHTVEEQDVYDGNFPTVMSPNPEEASALKMALELGNDKNAELVMGTDPDADRVGIAVKDDNNNLILLNGNQAASVLIYYLLSEKKKNNQLKDNQYIAKTIVTTELLKDIADYYNVECIDVLTGFKFIADLIKRNQNKKEFIGGGEESYGYLVGEFIRDKDAVISCTMFAEIAAWAKEQGKSIYQILKEIYAQFGQYQEALVSLTKKGKTGAEQIEAIMVNFRNDPPKELAGSPILCIKDYLSSEVCDFKTKETSIISLPKSNVLQFISKDGSKVSIRPSGTEPKIKFYISVKISKLDKGSIEKNKIILEKKIKNIVDDLNIK
ncbi:MAG: phospho-sugar mutase [Bacteroidales bacterium]